MSLQHSLLAMFEKVLDNSESFGGSFQSFCMYNSWFYYNSLKLINSFPSRRKFRTKIDPSYSPYLDLLVGVPQGSVLVPLFFYAIANLTLITRMTLLLMLVNQTWTLYWVNWKKTLLQFVHGFRKTIWNLMAKNFLTAFDNVLHINVGEINSVVASMKNY